MFVWAKICLFFSVETRTRDEDGERENADRLSGLEGITHFLDDLKFPDDYTIRNTILSFRSDIYGK